MTPEYRGWLKEQATLIKSDGCTHALEWSQDCCYEHDLGYYYGRDPRDAFSRAQKGVEDPWKDAERIRKVTLDWRLGKCGNKWWRFPATLFGGIGIWRRKRAERK